MTQFLLYTKLFNNKMTEFQQIIYYNTRVSLNSLDAQFLYANVHQSFKKIEWMLK